jgi:hypothetical protein
LHKKISILNIEMSYTVVINSNERANPNDSANNAIYNFNWDVLPESEYEVDWKLQKIYPLTPFKTLLINKPPWGQYSASSWSGTVLTDITKNGHNATTSGVSSGSASGNGSTVSIPYIKGTTTSTILFPTGSIPTTFTIASITRYETTGNKERILTSTAGNWVLGHAGSRGIAYFGDWMTTQTTKGNITDWLRMVANNNGVIPNNILVDGIGSGIINGGFGNYTLSVNMSPYGQTSDFQFSQLIIWPQALTVEEMQIVSNALENYLSTGVLE